MRKSTHGLLASSHLQKTEKSRAKSACTPSVSSTILGMVTTVITNWANITMGGDSMSLNCVPQHSSSHPAWRPMRNTMSNAMSRRQVPVNTNLRKELEDLDCLAFKVPLGTFQRANKYSSVGWSVCAVNNGFQLYDRWLVLFLEENKCESRRIDCLTPRICKKKPADQFTIHHVELRLAGI